MQKYLKCSKRIFLSLHTYDSRSNHIVIGINVDIDIYFDDMFFFLLLNNSMIVTQVNSLSDCTDHLFERYDIFMYTDDLDRNYDSSSLEITSESYVFSILFFLKWLISLRIFLMISTYYQRHCFVEIEKFFKFINSFIEDQRYNVIIWNMINFDLNNIWVFREICYDFMIWRIISWRSSDFLFSLWCYDVEMFIGRSWSLS